MNLVDLLEALDEPGQRWRVNAACRGMDPKLFYPASPDAYAAEYAKTVCGRCPVRVACGEYGAKERDGVWGGLSAKDRERARKQAARQRAANRLTNRLPDVADAI